MYIDWYSPIEAVGPDDNVVPMRFTGESIPAGLYVTKAEPRVHGSIFWTAYGKNFDCDCRWHLRNTLKYPAAKPSTPSNEELIQRMEKLVREMAALSNDSYSLTQTAVERKLVADAQSIVSDLPKPVDPINPDEVAAMVIVRRHYPEARDSYRGRRFVVALEAIKLGRTLAAGGTAHE